MFSERPIGLWHLHKIPRVLHLYWGGENMSFLRHLTVVSFHQYNPDWQIKVHIPKEVYKGNPSWNTPEYSHGFKIPGRYMEQLVNYGVQFVEHDFESYGIRSDIPETFKADYLRYHLLSTEGGVWSDFDILYFRPMSMAKFNNEENSDADTGLYIEKGLPHISFLFSSAKNPMYSRLEVLAKEKLDLSRYQSIGSELFALPEMQVDQFPIKLCKIDKNSIYYFEWKRLPDLFINEAPYPDDAVGIHWFAGTPISQDYDSRITIENVFRFNNTLCKTIVRHLNLGIDYSLDHLSRWHLSKIPKVLHLYWGGQNLSYLRYLTVVSFRQHNPDWKIKIHRPLFPFGGGITWSDLPHSEKGLASAGEYAYIEKLADSYVEFVGHDFEKYGFENNIPETFKADYLRYLLLSTEGGVWSDFDILYFRSMNSMFLNRRENADLDIGICIFEDGLVPIGFLLSSPGNPVYSKLEVLAKQKLNLKKYQSIGADLFFLPEMNFRNFPINFGLISKNTVYELDWSRTKDIFINNVSLGEDAIGIHWYAGDLIAQQFNERITPDNVAYGNSTLSNVIMNYVDVKRTKKSVSILIPSFNRSEQLKWNLFSIASQKTEFDFEIIVLNDGFEDDETSQVCKLFNRRLQIRYLFTGQRNNGTLSRRLKHQGAEHSLNVGLNQAIGETIVIAGAEIFMPQCDVLDKLIKAAKADPAAVIIPYIIDDFDGDILKELNKNFGSIEIIQDEKMQICREVIDVFDKPYLMAYQHDLCKPAAHLVQIEAEAVHLYHGQSNAKRNYRVIEV